MANWVADYLARTAGAQIVGRAAHALHVRAGNDIQAFFLGSPIHWNNGGAWEPIDDTLLDVAGVISFNGCPVRVNAAGLVELIGTPYWQQTDNIGIFNQANRQYSPLLTLPSGVRDGNCLVRDVPTWGTHRLYLTPSGLREELTMLRAPAGGANDWLVIRSAIGGKTWGEGFLGDTDILTLPNGQKVYSPIPSGEDANGFPVPIRRYARVVGATQFLYTGIKISDLQGAAFPVIFDPDIVGDTADGRIQGTDATYSSARTTSNNYSTTDVTRPVGQQHFSGSYYCNRLFLKFDTSSIGSGSTITQVNLQLVCTNDPGGADFDLDIMKQDWSAQDPLSNANREAAFDNCLAGTLDDNIWRNTLGMSINTQYSSGNLNTSYPNKTGNTYYSLIDSLQLAGTPPGDGQNVNITMALADHTTASYRPTLKVTYTAAGILKNPYHWTHAYMRM